MYGMWGIPFRRSGTDTDCCQLLPETLSINNCPSVGELLKKHRRYQINAGQRPQLARHVSKNWWCTEGNTASFNATKWWMSCVACSAARVTWPARPPPCSLAANNAHWYRKYYSPRDPHQSEMTLQIGKTDGRRWETVWRREGERDARRGED